MKSLTQTPRAVQPRKYQIMSARPSRSMARAPRWAAVVAAAVAVIPLLTSSRSSAQEFIDPAREYKVKGVFLYSFGRHVKWPADVEAERFVIGVLGESRITATLAEIAKKKQLKGRRIEIAEFNSAGEIKPCQILFISRSVELEDEQAALRLVRGKRVLVVGETSEFTRRGGGISFQVDASAIRFQINIAVTRAAGLQLDAKLLKIGKTVSFPVSPPAG